MKTQRIAIGIRKEGYIGDDCPVWIYTLDMKKAINKRFNFHWHPELEVYYIESGNYELYTQDEAVSLCPGDIYIVGPGVDHSVRGMSEKAKYYSIGFDLKLIRLDETHFFQKTFVEPLATGMLDFNPVIRRSDPGYSNFIGPIRQIIGHLTQPDKVSVFFGILSFCHAIMSRSTPKERLIKGCSREHESVRFCAEYMQTNYMHKITLEQLAQMVNLHPNYLCTVFNKYEGCSPMTYLNKLRMTKARSLLRTTDLSVRQVAERTGFNSASFFSRRFKAVMGTSPKEYSDAYRKK